MIKCENGKVQIKGVGYQLLSDLTCIIKALREEGCSEELLQKCLFISGLSDEEVVNEAKGTLTKLLGKLMEDK